MFGLVPSHAGQKVSNVDEVEGGEIQNCFCFPLFFANKEFSSHQRPRRWYRTAPINEAVRSASNRPRFNTESIELSFVCVSIKSGLTAVLNARESIREFFS